MPVHNSCGSVLIAAAGLSAVYTRFSQEDHMSYVDGYVLPVPSKNLDAYKKMARKAGKVWMEYGALHYAECVGDDVKPGKVTSFPQAVKLKDDEVVVFSWIVYKNRRDRDRINKLVMADPRLASMADPKNLPFDGRRMFWGGFKPAIEFNAE
jgi:uncharacterized protein YbaA (DUF1428 family)